MLNDECDECRGKMHVLSVKSKFAFTWEYYPVRYFYHITVGKWIGVSVRNMLKCVDRDVQAKPESENAQLQSPHGTRGTAGAKKNRKDREAAGLNRLGRRSNARRRAISSDGAQGTSACLAVP